METIIIESNRRSAYEQQTANEKSQVLGQLGNVPDEQHPNHEWNTTVERGIPLREGDTVKVSASMIHLRGDPASTIEFAGSAGQLDPDGLVDNAAILGTAHYITNRHQFNMPLPLWGTIVRVNVQSPHYGEPALDNFPLFLRAYPYQAIEAFALNRNYKPGPNRRAPRTQPFFSYDGTQAYAYEPAAQPTEEINMSPPPEFSIAGGDIAGDRTESRAAISPAHYVGLDWKPRANGPWDLSRPNCTRLYHMSAGFNDIISANPDTSMDGTQKGFNQINYWNSFGVPELSGIALQIKTGFATPSDVAEELTQQFHRRSGQADAWTTTDIIPKSFEFDAAFGYQNYIDQTMCRKLPFVELPIFPPIGRSIPSGSTAPEPHTEVYLAGSSYDSDIAGPVVQLAAGLQPFMEYTAADQPTLLPSNKGQFVGKRLQAVTDGSYKLIPTATGQICYGREAVLDELNGVANNYTGTQWHTELRGEYVETVGTLPGNWEYGQMTESPHHPQGAPSTQNTTPPGGDAQFDINEAYGMFWNHALCGDIQRYTMGLLTQQLGASTLTLQNYNAARAAGQLGGDPLYDPSTVLIGGWSNTINLPAVTRENTAYLNTQFANAGIPAQGVKEFGLNLVVTDRLSYRDLSGVDKGMPWLRAVCTTQKPVSNQEWNDVTTPGGARYNTHEGKGDAYGQLTTTLGVVDMQPGSWVTTNIVATLGSLSFMQSMMQGGEYPTDQEMFLAPRCTTVPVPANPEDPAQQNLDAVPWSTPDTPFFAAPTEAQKRAMDRQHRIWWRFGRADDEFSCEAVGKKVNLACCTAVLEGKNGVTTGVPIHKIPGSGPCNGATSYITDTPALIMSQGFRAGGTWQTNAMDGNINGTDTPQRLMSEFCDGGHETKPHIELLSRWDPQMDPRHPQCMLKRPAPLINSSRAPAAWVPAYDPQVGYENQSWMFQLKNPLTDAYPDELYALAAKLGIACVFAYYREHVVALFLEQVPGSVASDWIGIPFIAMINATDFEYDLSQGRFTPSPMVGEFIGGSTSLNDNSFSKCISTQKTMESVAAVQRDLVVTAGATPGAETPNAANGNAGIDLADPTLVGGQQLGLNTATYPQGDVTNLYGSYARGTTTPGSETGDYVFPRDPLACATHRYSACVYIGADDPQINFDPTYGRFTVSNMHCATRSGNGVFQWITAENNAQFASISAFQNSEQAMISSMGAHGFNGPLGPQSSMNVNHTGYAQTAAPLGPLPGPWFYYLNGEKWCRLMPFSYHDIRARVNPPQVISSQAGLAIWNIRSPTKSQIESGIMLVENPAPYPTDNTMDGQLSFLQPNMYTGTIFQKLGFDIEQLLPQWGRQNSTYNRSNYARFQGVDIPTALQKYNNMVRPFTTNAYTFSSINIGAVQNAIEYPMQNLGIARKNQAITEAASDVLVANNLPFKLDFPYLVVYSDIVQGQKYYGGRSECTRLPAVAYISRSYNTGDFFYAFSTDWVKTVTIPYVLNNFSVSIRRPDGQPAQIDSRSAIIFEISRFLPVPRALPPADDDDKKKK